MAPDGRWRESLRSGAAGTGPDHALMAGVTDDTAARIADTIMRAPATAHNDPAWRHRWEQTTTVKPSDVGLPRHMD